MRSYLWAIGLLMMGNAQAQTDPFYANAPLQRTAPTAFALQPESRDWVRRQTAMTQAQGEALVEAVQADAELYHAIAQWTELDPEAQHRALRRLFVLECQVLGITPPTLLIDNHSYPGKTVYFDFSQPGPGTVYLNPDKLASMPSHASLAFLLHETRHSYQWQLAQSGEGQQASGYDAAFAAQQGLEGFSFSDFLMLLNEYEAFQFGNYVLGRLTDWRISLANMGTYASQYDDQGQLKLDLSRWPDGEDWLSRYNRLAQPHWQARQAGN
ncbi:hypothetical protein [Ferrimonas marina]|uniref:DUF2268 domain-containing protein n=1 Tax=Ferrimonas marina TaxID=299255 RepID=A0A1M5XZX4_9GAMM|nr:hypothetical protein [Ferrimonas marina]SHI05266.1 hypothetical protein SAMN02745129_3843 [Ferrimonas marina]